MKRDLVTDLGILQIVSQPVVLTAGEQANGIVVIAFIINCSLYFESSFPQTSDCIYIKSKSVLTMQTQDEMYSLCSEAPDSLKCKAFLGYFITSSTYTRT